MAQSDRACFSASASTAIAVGPRAGVHCGCLARAARPPGVFWEVLWEGREGGRGKRLWVYECGRMFTIPAAGSAATTAAFPRTDACPPVVGGGFVLCVSAELDTAEDFAVHHRPCRKQVCFFSHTLRAHTQTTRVSSVLTHPRTPPYNPQAGPDPLR